MNPIVFVSILSSLSVSAPAPKHCETFQRFLIQGSGTVVVYNDVSCMPSSLKGRAVSTPVKP